MKKSILFIINPISGGKIKTRFPQLAGACLDKELFEAEYSFSGSVGHAQSLAKTALKNDTDILVAVGGDGTINEVASVVVGTGKKMGIVPYGSGNGLARMLGIPLNSKQALLQLNRLKFDAIDTATFNERKFFNVAGMGFDAHISHRFAEGQTRGLTGYIKKTFTEISQYKPQHYHIEIDGKVYEREAFMVSIANSSQFGNNAHISPFASVRDGLLDVCIIKPFPLYHALAMGYRMFNKTAHLSAYVEIIKGEQIKIVREQSGVVHVDGEPQFMGAELNIRVKPLSLNIIS